MSTLVLVLFCLPVTDSAGSSRLLPRGELLSAVTNMALSDNEIFKLMEVLNQKAGVRHGSWQLVRKQLTSGGTTDDVSFYGQRLTMETNNVHTNC